MKKAVITYDRSSKPTGPVVSLDLEAKDNKIS